jgi:hypothetical protein
MGAKNQAINVTMWHKIPMDSEVKSGNDLYECFM